MLFLLLKGVVVLKGLICNCIHLRGYGGFEITDFGSLWEGVMVMKGIIFKNFHFGMMCCFSRDRFLVIFTLEGYGGLERTDVNMYHFGGVVVFK